MSWEIWSLYIEYKPIIISNFDQTDVKVQGFNIRRRKKLILKNYIKKMPITEIKFITS